jgi:glycerate 2-kinase
VTGSRQDLIGIYQAAVAAVDPAALVQAHLHREGPLVCVDTPDQGTLRWPGSTLVVGAGKAAARMAAGCEAALGAESVRGLVIAAEGCTAALSRIECAEAGHPLPDGRGLRATERLCRLLSPGTLEPTLVLLSGGASSLLVRPRPPVTLADKITVTELLLRSGADIARVNAVRKHLSLVKGGGLLRLRRPRPLVALILSDVVGDDPSVIGSGPTAGDPTTFDDADQILRASNRDQAIPDSVWRLLSKGRKGEVPDTVKPHDPALDGVYNVTVGSNRTALEAAAAEADQRGYVVRIAPAPLVGETVAAARRWYDWLRGEDKRLSGRRRCFLAGGETTVTVTGKGRGGRNQEFALALAPQLSGKRLAVLSAGTDGIDGPTEAAGAFVDGSTAARARSIGLDSEAMLANNDSYHFFKRLGDLFLYGPTGTNVMDIKIAIATPS